MKPTVLVIDDEKTFRVVVEEALTAEGFEVATEPNGETGFQRWEREPSDFVILDNRLPDVEGLSILARLVAKAKETQFDTLVVMATAHADVATSVRALKLGAFDYLVKPIQLAELVVTFRKALETRRLRQKVRHLDEQAASMFGTWIEGTSPRMRSVTRQVEQVSQATDTTVLIHGESGTGKEAVANLIHRLTPERSDHPIVTINCASLNENLFETELFGYEQGSFPEAKSQKRGLLEAADGGTLFLDEIGAMPLGTQAKLLRVVESTAFRRIGATRDLHVSVRVIATTKSDLAAEVERGTFRLDLLQRLDVFPIDLPPLRGRTNDIFTLAEHFLAVFGARLRRGKLELTDPSKEMLQRYHYPGNVRELKNIIERAAILASGKTIGPDCILLRAESFQRGPFFEVELDDSGQPPPYESVGNAYIDRVVRFARGNRSQAARLLELSYPTVIKKLEEHAHLTKGRT